MQTPTKRTDLAAATSCHSLLLLDDRASGSELERKWVAEMAPLVLSLSAGPASPSRLCPRLLTSFVGEGKQERMQGRIRNLAEAGSGHRDLSLSLNYFLPSFLVCAACPVAPSCLQAALFLFFFPGIFSPVATGKSRWGSKFLSVRATPSVGHQTAVVMKDVTFFIFVSFW